MTLIEVGPRDGLQNEKNPIPTEVKRAFIGELVAAGLHEIEVTSFVSPKWVPQLADAAELLAQLPNGPAWNALVPNLRGLERALECGLSRIAVFTAASETFVQKNINSTIADSLTAFDQMVKVFRSAVPNGFVRGYVSTIFECPYEGRISPGAVVEVVERLFALGCDEVSLGDTIGVGAPPEVRCLVAALNPAQKGATAWHFHDTRGTAIANVDAALDAGYTRFDSSAGGLGGCPYAPGAGGNVATEDLVYFLERCGIATGVDLDRLAKASLQVLEVLGREPSSRVQRAVLSQCPPA